MSKKQAFKSFEGEASCHMFIVLGAEVKDLLSNQMAHPAVTLFPWKESQLCGLSVKT